MRVHTLVRVRTENESYTRRCEKNTCQSLQANAKFLLDQPYVSDIVNNRSSRLTNYACRHKTNFKHKNKTLPVLQNVNKITWFRKEFLFHAHLLLQNVPLHDSVPISYVSSLLFLGYHYVADPWLDCATWPRTHSWLHIGKYSLYKLEKHAIHIKLAKESRDTKLKKKQLLLKFNSIQNGYVLIEIVPGVRELWKRRASKDPYAWSGRGRCAHFDYTFYNIVLQVYFRSSEINVHVLKWYTAVHDM